MERLLSIRRCYCKNLALSALYGMASKSRKVRPFAAVGVQRHVAELREAAPHPANVSRLEERSGMRDVVLRAESTLHVGLPLIGKSREPRLYGFTDSGGFR
jgi:hypothetical protein